MYLLRHLLIKIHKTHSISCIETFVADFSFTVFAFDCGLTIFNCQKVPHWISVLHCVEPQSQDRLTILIMSLVALDGIELFTFTGQLFTVTYRYIVFCHWQINSH